MADTTDALLPCPFCGGKACWEAGSDNQHWAGATCKACGVTLDDQDSGCMERVTAAWNTRATPAGSASGEVQRYFRGEYGMVAAGPEYPHRDGDTYWVAEQDYAALQAEVAQLQAALAEARNLLCRIRDDRSWRTNDNALWQDILAALHQRKENGHGA